MELVALVTLLLLLEYVVIMMNVGRCRVKYGIEAYFAPKERALELEDKLRDGGVAELMVTSSGQVALRDVTGTNHR